MEILISQHTITAQQWGGACIEYPGANKLQDLLANLKYSGKMLLNRLLSTEYPQISA